MEIKCACGNSFFTKQMKLKRLMGKTDIIEEKYYTCSKCGFTVARKEVINFPITKDGEVILFREFE